MPTSKTTGIAVSSAKQTLGDDLLRHRQAASQREFFRALGGGAAGSRCLQLDGEVQATIVPARPWFSIFNSVLFRDAEALRHVLPELASAYENAGVKAWTVWTPSGDERGAELLESAGHALDSTPMLMAAPIASIDLEHRAALDLEPRPSWEMVARCNDRAHGVLEPWTMAAVFETMDDPATHLYAARHQGQTACCLLARESEGDCYLWFVATVPEAQRLGLASELIRRALGEALERGCVTTSLESTHVAEAVYERLGYRALGRYGMWERRSTE